MSGDKYYIRDQQSNYFLTFTVVEWIDVFTRPEYKMVIVDALNYCIAEKGLVCKAWVLMSNHMHIIASAQPPAKLSDIIRDYKKFTSKKLTELIQTLPESRREWMLHKFAHTAKYTGRAENYKLWQDGSHAVCVDDATMFRQRLDYIHNNPVRQQIVSQPSDYIYSSAYDYAGMKGLVNITLAL